MSATFFDSDSLSRYVKNDWVLKVLQKGPDTGRFEGFLAQGWLKSMPEKRCTFAHVYKDLLHDRRGLRVLDVGAGISVFTPLLMERHAYHAIDPLSAPDERALEKSGIDLSAALTRDDWNACPPAQSYDLIMANDLFPNVDQRLRDFILWSLPHCRELRLVLTYFVTPRSYRCLRVDCEEFIHVSAWRPEWIQWTLAEFADRIPGFTPESVPSKPSGIFANGRSVLHVSICGDQPAT